MNFAKEHAKENNHCQSSNNGVARKLGVVLRGKVGILTATGVSKITTSTVIHRMTLLKSATSRYHVFIAKALFSSPTNTYMQRNL